MRKLKLSMALHKNKKAHQKKRKGVEVDSQGSWVWLFHSMIFKIQVLSIFLLCYPSHVS